MNLIRRDPFRELEEVSTRLNRLFNQPLGRRLIEDEGSLMAEWSPAVDVQETDGEYLIKADLPDVKKEDVRVEVQDGMLCLRGERQQEKEEKGKKFHRIGRRAESTPAEVGEREAEEHRGEGFVT